MEIKSDKEDLEKALAREKPKISKEEEIGFHKGTLNTLLAERNELIKMIVNVESIMKATLNRLDELGVKIDFEKPKEK